MKRRIRLILLDSDPEPVMALLALQALVWGTWLLLSPHAFSATPSYRVLMELFPAVGWAVLMVLLGITQMAALLSFRNWARRATSMAGFVVWAFLAIAITMANPRIPGCSVSILMALANGWGYIVSSFWGICR